MRLLRAFAWLALLAATAWLPGCAPGRQIPTIAPGQAYTIDGISVRSPATANWVVADRTAQNVSFAKQGRSAGETLAAQLLIFDLPPTETAEQFQKLIEGFIANSWNPQRFDLIRMTSEYSTERKYPCVLNRSNFYDKQAKVSPTATEKLLFEIEALYCRHPLRPTAAFAAVYSHRGRSPYPGLAEEAAAYRKGVDAP